MRVIPMKLFISFVLVLLSVIVLNAQTTYVLSGEVKDLRSKEPLVGAIVTINNPTFSLQTDKDGHFHFINLDKKEYKLLFSIMGYETQEQNILLDKDINHLVVYLETSDIGLGEVVIKSTTSKESSLSSQTVGKTFFFENNNISFAKSLSKISGVASMDIGAGWAKPVIRGMGFNRIAVVDKGITQQDQQWGADHGLAIDMFDVDNVVVHKGPMSLQFGSDAIGGAIEILPSETPQENMYWGDVTFIAKSNNELLGISAMNAIKRNKWYVKLRYTGQRFGDYRVPSDKFEYLTYEFPIYNRRLKNTAGKDDNLAAQIRYSDKNFETSFNLSNVYQKAGFFTGAHGVPDKSKLEHDGSFRNIDMPFSNTNHFKLINTTSVRLSPNLKWTTNLGFQNNHRQEWSYFHDHYGNQQPPSVNPDLELDFKLKTYSLDSKVVIGDDRPWSSTIGLQSELQQNRVGGYSFFLPQFDKFSAGLYALSNYDVSARWTISGGLRYDYAQIDVEGFYDEILAQYLKDRGFSDEKIAENAQRAYDLDKRFGNISGAIGAVFQADKYQTLRLNAGSSFRFPTAIELAVNGIHHGAFRYERGNPDLKPERGYQLDMGYDLKKNHFSLTLSPFVSYYSNYIFLEPQILSSVIPHAGQTYLYKEAEALFAGSELMLNIDLFSRLAFTTTAQYVYNRNLADNYPLPFTPPFSMTNGLLYSGNYKFIQSYKIGVEHELYAAQNRKSRNEETTPGANLFNFSINSNLKLDNFRFSLGFQVQNIFDTNYLNHLSFYRTLNIPEPGRNIQLLIKVPFYN